MKYWDRLSIIWLAPLIILFFAGGFFVAEMVFSQDTPSIVNILSDTFVTTDVERPTYSYGYATRTIYDRAYDSVGDIVATYSRSAIVAHHLLASKDIARVFETVGSKDVETVVVISPNHFSIGRSPAQISFGRWQTPYGDLMSDIRSAKKLLSNVKILKNEERTFEREHGIAAITPFVKRSFPNAKIIAIVAHETLSPKDARTIGDAIATELPNAVVIASIDMSHYLPSSVANYHDEITLRAIEAGFIADDLELEIDSNATLRIIQRVNAVRGDTAFRLTAHTDSLSDVGHPTQEGTMDKNGDWRENTSHILGFFTNSGKKSDVRHPTVGEDTFAGIHFVGDVMLDRDVRRLMDAQGVDAPWADVDRFLQGSHLRVGNLEGTVNNRTPKYTYNPPFEFNFTPKSVAELQKHMDLVSLANNHTQDVGVAGEVETRNRLDDIKLAWFGSYISPVFVLDRDVNGVPLTFIGYHAFQPDEKTLLDEIRAADVKNRFVIVMPHWGAEYVTQTTSQKNLAAKMAEAGADLIVGGHPHVIQGIDIIEDTPVFYSLGNFIFDQRFGDTMTGLTAGVVIDSKTITLHLLPIATRNGQPSPLSDTETRSILKKIASQSPNKLRDQIRSGIIIIPYDR